MPARHLLSVKWIACSSSSSIRAERQMWITALLFSLLQRMTTDALPCFHVLETFPVVSHSFCKTSSLMVWSNSRGKKIAVCLAFLREGYTTQKICKMLFTYCSNVKLHSLLESHLLVPKNRRDPCLLLFKNLRCEALVISVTPADFMYHSSVLYISHFLVHTFQTLYSRH